MTTSRETNNLNHSMLRELVGAANAMPLADRITLLKALVPGIAREMTPRDFEGLMVELRLKGERFYDAVTHPGEGRDSRHVMGERDIEER
ncbi:MAG: hypothetical protein Q7S20_09150 [Gemmatimonadaceae bacterium]|nr:hypothetical protein [Gemmatimonadaceae bacterium]